mgnify:CR=1 FL=1
MNDLSRLLNHEEDLREKATEMLNDGIDWTEVVDAFATVAQSIDQSFQDKVH